MTSYEVLKMLYDNGKAIHNYESVELIMEIFDNYGKDIDKYDPFYDYGFIYDEIEEKAGKSGFAALEAGFDKKSSELSNLTSSLNFYKNAS